MKVLILSCNTGGGHNAAAEAIAAELKAREIPCDVLDSLKFAPRIKRDFIEKGHTVMYKYAPELYGETYEYTEKQNNHYWLYMDYSKYSAAAAAYILRKKYDTVICVHVFPGLMLTAARKLLNLNIRQYFVATDYTCSPGVELLDMDQWFIPRGLSDEFISSGIPAGKLTESGIPISSAFHSRISKADAGKQLGLRDDIPLILMGAGAIGCGPIRELALAVRTGSENAPYAAVLCGNNKKLLKELTLEVDDPLLIPVGFTDKVRLWMAAADVMITKPGGLSSTEAAAAGVPLVFMDAVPGLETRNMNYFVRNGCGISAVGVEALCAAALDLIGNEEKRNAILAAQKALFSTDSTKAIADAITAGL